MLTAQRLHVPLRVVVCWQICMPTLKRKWTLFVWRYPKKYFIYFILPSFWEPIAPMCYTRWDEQNYISLVYVLTIFYASSNLYNDLLSFFTNLYVYHITVVTTYGYSNYCFVSTYVYECMIDFICNNLYLICGSNSCIIDVVFVATFVLHVWKNYFCSNLYINLCVRQLTLFTTHAYDMLCLWQFVHMTDFIFYDNLCS